MSKDCIRSDWQPCEYGSGFMCYNIYSCGGWLDCNLFISLMAFITIHFDETVPVPDKLIAIFNWMIPFHSIQNRTSFHPNPVSAIPGIDRKYLRLASAHLSEEVSNRIVTGNGKDQKISKWISPIFQAPFSGRDASHIEALFTFN